MSFDKDEPQADAWLRAAGIQHGIRHLIGRPALCRECVTELLGLFKGPYSMGMRAAIAEALFECNPPAKEKRETMRVLLGILKESPGKRERADCRRLAKLVAGATLVDGFLIDHVEASQVHEIGQLTLDHRLGELREEFTYALRKIGNADAILYLEQAAKDPQIASFALLALTRLRADARTLTLCEEALKLPDLADRARVENMRSNLQRGFDFNREQAEVDSWLRDKGIQNGIAYLSDDPSLYPDSVPVLLELLRLPFSLNVRAVAARALFRRKPSGAQKQEAVEAVLTMIRQGRGQDNIRLETLVLNELAQNVGADKVHEIGRMMLDEGFGELRGCFTEPLRRIANDEAIGYLRQATKIPVAAPLALSALMRLRVAGTLELCEEALKQPGMLYKDAVKETYRKLQRKLAKKKGTVSHVTNEPMPEGLEEWSANLDRPDLAKVLRGIQKCVEGGFGKAEIAEVRTAADELSPEVEESPESQTARLKFEVKFNGGNRELWLEVFCDDEDAYDLYVFGHSALIKEVEGVLKKILPE